MAETRKEGAGAPVRKSIRERMADRSAGTNPLVESSLSMLSEVDDTTGTFSIDMTGELVVDQLAPLPVSLETTTPKGVLDPLTASAYHLLVLPAAAQPEDLEALAVSVWNEAGWLSPGVLRLQESATLEGPWSLDAEGARELGLKVSEDDHVWLVRCRVVRGPAPSAEMMEINELARAFPEGMPSGLEDRVIDFLRRVSRRLDGYVRIAGSGHAIEPSPESAVNLKVYSNTWLPPEEIQALLEPYIPDIYSPSPVPDSEGAPYAFLAPTGSRSQVLIGVRPETAVPRALRWEMWAKGRLYLYEIVWAPPEDLYDLDKVPTRSGRLERTRASRTVEVAAALLAQKLDDHMLGGAAVIDEDDFLVGLDVLPPEEEEPRP